MAAKDPVLIDTCIWVQFFNRPPSDDNKAVDLLLDDDRAALVGPILSEMLLGFRQDAQADWESSVLRGLHFLRVSWDEWRVAAHLGRRLAANGNRLPLSDLVIAADALEQNAAVYTTDPHFELIPGLKHHIN